MDRKSPLIACAAILISLATPALATPALATKIRKDWETSMNHWTELTKNASTASERENLFRKRPDATAQLDQMWTAIGSTLKEEWTIEHAAWFLLMHQSIPLTDATAAKRNGDRCQAIKQAVIDHHLKSPKLTTLCMTLSQLGDPQSLSMLEKIEANNPEPKIQGVAALGIAVILRGLGDDPELMRRRLTLLRKAIINSADVSVGTISVANVAENELYLIRYLSKGRVAPDVTGKDAAGKALDLSQFKGSVVILLFWSSNLPQSDHTLEFTRNMTRKFAGKPVEILGVNQDSLPKLRSMIADESVTWKNISDPDGKIAREFRVSTLPTVYVLDPQQRIQYSGNLGSFAELAADALIPR